MKTIFITTIILLTAAAFSNVAAQVTPPGAGDKNLQDTNVKGRSNELERIKRDADKEDGKGNGQPAPKAAATAPPTDELAAKYDQIKTDYEQIQLSQDAVIKAYQVSDKVDYAQIGKSAAEINGSAMRLNTNLFPATVAANADAKKDEKPEKETKQVKSVRDLIVELDGAVGSFATSTMFQNLRLVDPKVAVKTRLDLENIIRLSAALNQEADKMRKAGK